MKRKQTIKNKRRQGHKDPKTNDGSKPGTLVLHAGIDQLGATRGATRLRIEAKNEVKTRNGMQRMRWHPSQHPSFSCSACTTSGVCACGRSLQKDWG